jgi:hypothetical protein
MPKKSHKFDVRNACVDDIIAHLQRNEFAQDSMIDIFADDKLAVTDWVISLTELADDGYIDIHFSERKSAHLEINYLLSDLVQNGYYRALDKFSQFFQDRNISVVEVIGNNRYLRRIEFDNNVSCEAKLLTLQWICNKVSNEKFSAMIQYSVSDAIQEGDVEILTWLIDRDAIFEYNYINILRRPIDTLNWLWDHYLQSRIEFKYDEYTICGMINNISQFDINYDEKLNELLLVLDWFYDRRDQIEFKYNAECFDNYAAGNAKFLQVFEWFYARRDELGFKYNRCIDYVCSYFLYSEDIIPILDWFWSRRNEIGFRYTSDAVDRCHSVKILQWFYSHVDEIEIKYTSMSITHAIQSLKGNKSKPAYCGKDIILWWRDHEEFEFRYDPTCAFKSNIDTLNFWFENLPNYPLTMNCHAGDKAFVKFILENLDKLTVIGDVDKVRLSLADELT